jgi:hypothetical protein
MLGGGGSAGGSASNWLPLEVKGIRRAATSEQRQGGDETKYQNYHPDELFDPLRNWEEQFNGVHQKKDASTDAQDAYC